MKKGTTGAAPIAPTPYFLSHPYGSPDNRNAPQGFWTENERALLTSRSAGDAEQPRSFWKSSPSRRVHDDNVIGSSRPAISSPLGLDRSNGREDVHTPSFALRTPPSSKGSSTTYHHERRNSEALSPGFQALVAKSLAGRARRDITHASGGGIDNHLPSSAKDTAIGNFNIYTSAQGREWEVLSHSGSNRSSRRETVDSSEGRRSTRTSGGRVEDNNYYQSGKGRDSSRSSSGRRTKRERHRHDYEEEDQDKYETSQSRKRLDSSTTYSKIRGHRSRVSIPFRAQLTPPKGDHISEVKTSVPALNPTTTNSNLSNAVISLPSASTGVHSHSRTRSSNTLRQSFDLQSDGHYIRRVDLNGLTEETRPSSPFDSSCHSVLRRPYTDEEFSYRQSETRRRGDQRLTRDVFSPTGSDLFRSRGSSDLYGTRNLNTVARPSSTKVAVSLGTTDCGRRSRSHSIGHMGFFDRLRLKTINVLAQIGLFTPPNPPDHPPSKQAAQASSRHQSASRESRRSRSISSSASSSNQRGHRSGSSSVSTSIARDTSWENVRERSETDPRKYAQPSSSKERARGYSGGSLDDSLTRKARPISLIEPPAFNKKELSMVQEELSSISSQPPESAMEAIEHIMERIKNAMAHSQEEAMFEVRSFVDSGGIDALAHAIQTLGNSTGMAMKLMYVLRMTMLDMDARRQTIMSRPGHVLLERVPDVMREHRKKAHIFTDGLHVMNTLLADSELKQEAVSLMLSRDTLKMIRKAARDVSQDGSEEAILCVRILQATKNDEF